MANPVFSADAWQNTYSFPQGLPRRPSHSAETLFMALFIVNTLPCSAGISQRSLTLFSVLIIVNTLPFPQGSPRGPSSETSRHGSASNLAALDAPPSLETIEETRARSLDMTALTHLLQNGAATSARA